MNPEKTKNTTAEKKIEAVSNIIKKRKTESSEMWNLNRRSLVLLNEKLEEYKKTHSYSERARLKGYCAIRGQIEASGKYLQDYARRLNQIYNRDIVGQLRDVEDNIDGIFSNDDKTVFFPKSREDELRCIKCFAKAGYEFNESELIGEYFIKNNSRERRDWNPDHSIPCYWNPDPFYSNRFNGVFHNTLNGAQRNVYIYEAWHWAPHKFSFEEEKTLTELCRFGEILSALSTVRTGYNSYSYCYIPKKTNNLIKFVNEFTTLPDYIMSTIKPNGRIIFPDPFRNRRWYDPFF